MFKLTSILFWATISLAKAGVEQDQIFGDDAAKSGEDVFKDESSPWAVRGLVGYGTTSTLLESLWGSYDRVPGTSVYSLEISYLLKENWNDWPIDISIAGAQMFHRSDEEPKSVFQENIYVKAEWTDFWWNDYLRTRISAAEGLSFVDRVTFSESQRRKGSKSKRLLNYLDFSLSFNVADIGHLMKIDHLIKYQKSSFDNTWLVFNVSHRSGAFGVFGRYSDGFGEGAKRRTVKGGDNIIMIGLTHRF